MKSIFILLDSVITIYLWIIIINAILSWLVAFNILNTQNRFVFSVLDTTYKLTDPALNKIRRFIPMFGSIDISPVILILFLMFLRNIIFEIFAPRFILIMIIDGKKIAAELREELKKKVTELKSTYNAVPGLTVILVGEDPPSKIYVKNKEKFAKEVGMNSEVIRYPENVEEKVVLNKIKELNNNNKVSGILVQLPLTKTYR